MSTSPAPDFTATATSMLLLVQSYIRERDDESAIKIIKLELGAAFAAGGLKALEMVKEGIAKL